MALGYFVILPSRVKPFGVYESLPTSGDDETILLPIVQQTASRSSILSSLRSTTQRIQPLVMPYMAPLFLVYVSEYTINQVYYST